MKSLEIEKERPESRREGRLREPLQGDSSVAIMPIDTANLGESIYRSMAHALVTGALQPNDRVKIRDLAAQMGTSVTPVRDAILRLAQEGAFVALTPRDIRVPALTMAQYFEIRSIRIHLEGMAAAEAARNATPEQVKYLEDLIAENESAIRDRAISRAAELNHSFHFALVELAGMPILRDVLQGLWLRIGPLISATYKPAEPAIIQHHYEVLEAIRRGDALGAQNAIQTDIVDGTRTIMAGGLLIL